MASGGLYFDNLSSINIEVGIDLSVCLNNWNSNGVNTDSMCLIRIGSWTAIQCRTCWMKSDTDDDSHGFSRC